MGGGLSLSKNLAAGEDIFARILNKALNNRMVDPREIFIDGTHIKASANKKKYQKEQVAKMAKIYQEQLSKEAAAEREALGKKPGKKETIERTFTDAKEKHGMRYTHHRGLARVTSWARLKFAAMNLKKQAIWSCKTPAFPHQFFGFFHFYAKTPVLAA